ncbi:FtsX-like permease family protein [Zunongwangia endophytica]|uniref:FtsX-like permease family protein n=1 Tax=Zunongwangia endophytica TaxID=1808945 RepID=A0ABV8H2Y2_9FLAO|nr:FtsX-like permease family protein [Zunongwangia endophytica]MDN3596004.1 ABC transporter permease [Zunongwangia endophytica]
MIKNHIKIAWRNLLKNGTYSIINIVGLTIGLAACLAVTTVVIDESSYDRFWSKKDQVFRVNTIRTRDSQLQEKGDYALSGTGSALKDFPEVENITTIDIFEKNFSFRNLQGKGTKTTVVYTTPSFLDIFDVQITSGNPKKLIEGSSNILISEKLVAKYFNGNDPVGKIIKDLPTYNNTPNEYVITGVFKDIPENTHLNSEVIYLHRASTDALSKKQFGMFQTYYIHLKKGVDKCNFEAKFNDWYSDYTEAENPYKFSLQPLQDIYLKSDFAQNQKFKGSAKKLYILGGIAILLLIIACINYVNLTTARASHKMKENGVRKVLGAGKLQLIIQHLSESGLFFLIAGILSFLIYYLSLDGITSFIGHPLALTFTNSIWLFLSAFLMIFVLSIITGLYPALLISRISPIASLQKKFRKNATGNNLFIRKTLIVFQFSVSLIVLIAMIVVNQQVDLLKNKSVGFDSSNLLSINYTSWQNKGASFKNELLKSPFVEKASISSWLPSRGGGSMTKKIEDPANPDNEIEIWYIFADTDLAETLGLRLQKGRFLNTEYGKDAIDRSIDLSSDPTNSEPEKKSAIITLQAQKLLNIEELNVSNKEVEVTPVGVVSDFNNEDLRTSAKPIIIQADKNPDRGNLLVRIRPDSEAKVIAKINELWKEFYPNKLLEVSNVSQLLKEQYDAETKLLQFFSFFSALSLFLAALGVFGLIVQVTEQRVKEIGIRKVLGASVQSIVLLFSKDFLKTISIAIVIAIPIGWYAMQQWLQDYAHRIEIKWWVFGLAAMLVISIAMCTVGIQSAKKAIINPANSLKTE